MSAYLVDAYTIGRLAAWLGQTEERLCARILGAPPPAHVDESTTFRVALELANANIESIVARYPDCTDPEVQKPGTPAKNDTEYRLHCVAESRRWWADEHTPAELLGALRCYEYQACEFARWPKSKAFELVRLGQNLAVARIPGVRESWGLDKSKARQVTPLERQAIAWGAR